MSQTLTPEQQQRLQKAKQASERQNHDYAINLLKQLVAELPEQLELRRLLRANELLKFRGASGMARTMASLKVASMGMKAKGALKKDPDEAMRLAEDMLEIDPTNETANETLAEAADAKNLPEIGILAYETLRDAHPDKVDILKKLGNRYLQNGLPEKAQKTFDAAIKIAPNDGEALKGMKDSSAMHASQSGSWEEGSDYRDSLKNADEATALEQQKRVVKSVEAIDQQLNGLYAQYNENQSNLAVVKQIAELLDRKEDFENALQWYAYAFELSNQADPEIEKRMIGIRKRGVDSAIQAKRQEIETADESVRPQLEAELEQLRNQKAEFELQTARERVQKYPNDKSLRYELGKALFEAGNYKEAVPELQQAVNQPNCRHQAFNVLGKCYQARNIIDLALKQFETAKSEMLTMDNLKKEITYNLGLALEQAGRNEEALAQFKEIYEVDYHFSDVAERVESAYES